MHWNALTTRGLQQNVKPVELATNCTSKHAVKNGRIHTDKQRLLCPSYANDHPAERLNVTDIVPSDLTGGGEYLNNFLYYGLPDCKPL